MVNHFENDRAVHKDQLLKIYQQLIHFQRAGVRTVSSDLSRAIDAAVKSVDSTESASRPSVPGIPSKLVPEGSSTTRRPDVAKADPIPQDSDDRQQQPQVAKRSYQRGLSKPLSVGGGSWNTSALDEVARVAELKKLNETAQGCGKCQQLSQGRKSVVFGEGSPTARVAFFGEAPGADEDRQGRPFVGRSGQLLDKIIVASKLTRESVYILNSVKCRPPGNRNPQESEITNCRPFFESQLEIVQPEFIVCLGAVSVKALLGYSGPIGKLRGQFHQYRGAKVVVTYHPSYLLREPAAKHKTWEDMQMLMREAGLI